MVRLRVVYYLITSSKSWLDLVDFLNNQDGSVSENAYFVLDRAIKLKDGKYFGYPGKKNILLAIAIDSEEAFQNLLAKRILTPEQVVSYEEMDPNEFSKDPSRIFRDEIPFLKNHFKLLKYLKKNGFTFEDGSIPLTPLLLDYWYVPITSNTVYENVLPLRDDPKLIFDMDYIIIDEEITCKDGRVLGKKDQITVCFEFVSIDFRRPFQKLFEEGILREDQVFRAVVFNEKHLKIHYDWEFKKSYQSFNTTKEMTNYLEEINFTFEDGTKFIP